MKIVNANGIYGYEGGKFTPLAFHASVLGY